MRGWLAALAATLMLATGAQAQKPEMTKVHLGVGGKTSLSYLPLTVTEKLGYFKEAGLDVEISDFQGGAKSLQALMGGSVQVVTGSFDHTIQIQAKGERIVALVQMGRFPGFALALRKEKADAYKGPKDLKGMKIGVTAPGSSTHFMVLYMMAQAGLKPEDASFIGTGSGNTVVAAVKRGEVDAISNADPMINILDREGAVKIVADTRTADGTKAVYGGPYPGGVIYAQPAYIEKNAQTVQKVVNAFTNALKWIASHSAEDIAKLMPEEYALGNLPLYIKALTVSKPMYSPDGHFEPGAVGTAYAVLRVFDPVVGGATFDLTKTYNDTFVKKAISGK